MRLIDADALPRHGRRGGLVYWKDIENAPTVDAEPIRHGHWLSDEDGNISCSVCGQHGVGDNYCEKCGAKMDGNKNE